MKESKYNRHLGDSSPFIPEGEPSYNSHKEKETFRKNRAKRKKKKKQKRRKK